MADKSTPKQEQGLLDQYAAYMIDGQTEEGYPIVNMVNEPIFVLKYTTDPHAAVALAAYAQSCQYDYPKLAADLREELREQPECECIEPACQWCEIHGDTGNEPLEDLWPVYDDTDDDILRGGV